VVDEDALDPSEVAPLFESLYASSGDVRATILEALLRLPLSAADVLQLAIESPEHVRSLRPPWAETDPSGFTTYPPSASADLDARVADLGVPESPFWSGSASPRIEEEVAPAAVTRWFASAVNERNIDLGNDIVGWVSVYDGLFRPDLSGLFAQYRRAALAECAAWDGDRRPGTWFLRDPDVESWRGYRVLCWQIGWTVSRGGIGGLVPGLARELAAEDEMERAIAALLIADAADYVLTGEPPIFGGGHGPPPRPAAGTADPATLPQLLREGALAGVVPARRTAASHEVLPNEPHSEPGAVAPAPQASVDAPVHRASRLGEETAPVAKPGDRICTQCGMGNDPTSKFCRRCGSSMDEARIAAKPLRWKLSKTPIYAVAIVTLGGFAIAKWLLGWLTLTIDAGAPRLDDVQCTVFAPPAASRGSAILVQVFAHVPEEADDARAIATELDVGARRRAFRSLEAPVPVGSRLDFELRMPGLEIDDHVASLTWQGRTEAVQFGVSIPSAAPVGDVIGTVSISREGVPLGHVKFTLEVAAAAVGRAAEPQGIEARRYRFAFVSYASRDRDEVLRRVQMLSVAGVEYFQDVLDLEPGQVWSTKLEEAILKADVFLLFWSSRAKDSAWVRREVDFALARKAGDDLSPPEIRPVIIEGPPVIPPWDDLAHLHFNDRVLYFMSRPREN
jgi:hypothetical protein